MLKHFRYFRYLIIHKWFVFVECCKIGLFRQGLFHDLSKFRPSEWVPYANYFYGGYPTPSTKRAFDLAWLHHQKRNKHHWQYWVLIKDSGEIVIKPMPTRYWKEMVADWRGAGKAISGKDDTVVWYFRNKDNIMLHPDTRLKIEEELKVHKK